MKPRDRLKRFTGRVLATPDDLHHLQGASRQLPGRAPRGYGIDFGVLESGETALVELNDGYSLGTYGLEDDLYTELIVARWLELVATS